MGDPIEKLRESSHLDDSKWTLGNGDVVIICGSEPDDLDAINWGEQWREIADEIEATYMKLPVDADGVPIRPGDEMQFGTDAPVRVDSIGTSRCYCGDFGWFGSNGGFYGKGTLRSCRHVKPYTVESLLQELADEVWEASCACQTTWSDSGLDGIADRYAERIREAVEHD